MSDRILVALVLTGFALMIAAPYCVDLVFPIFISWLVCAGVFQVAALLRG